MIRGYLAIGALAFMGLIGWNSSAMAAAPYMLVETGRQYATLQGAVDAIGDKAGTIRIAPGLYRECAVQPRGDVAFVAAIPGQVVYEGKVCEDKATLVLRGRSSRVEGIIFQRLRIDDGNAAGIRLEHGNLVVRQAWFRDSDEGILAGNDHNGSALIEGSTFSRLGRCDRGLSCAHSIYFGEYANVMVRRCRFEAGRGGHYVKSRSTRIEVSESSFDDTAGHATNYMIDLSIGSTGVIRNNWFVGGRDKDNHRTFIAVSPEGLRHSADGLVIAANVARLAPGANYSSSFLTDWSGDAIHLANNTLGDGIRLYNRR